MAALSHNVLTLLQQMRGPAPIGKAPKKPTPIANYTPPIRPSLLPNGGPRIPAIGR